MPRAEPHRTLEQDSAEIFYIARRAQAHPHAVRPTPSDNVADLRSWDIIGESDAAVGSRGLDAGEGWGLVADEDYQLLVTAVKAGEELGYPKGKRSGLIIPELVRSGTIVEPNL